MSTIYRIFAMACVCLVSDISFSRIESSNLSYTERIRKFVYDINLKQSNWSKPFVVFRTGNAKVSLENANAANKLGLLKFVNDRADSNSTHRYLKATLIQIDQTQVSDYFHCEAKQCEFRLTCFGGPCVTPLSVIDSKFKRVGVSSGTGSLQLSRCSTSHVCMDDIYLSSESGSFALANCEKDTPCYYGFPEKGLRQTYKVLGTSVKARALADKEQLAKQLDTMEKELLANFRR